MMNELVNEFYRKVLRVVCQETGMSERDLLDGKTEDCVSARYILIKALSMRLTDREISDMTGKTQQCVNGIRNRDKQMKWSMSVTWKSVCAALGGDDE